MKEPFLKGKLTAISLAILTLVQTPNLIGDLSNAGKAFAENAEKPISVVSLVAAVGIIYGAFRRAAGYFGK
jgi:hypothetical protein